MNTKLEQELNRNLEGYSTHVDTWHPEDIDTFLMLGAREWLQENLTLLSSAQRQALSISDNKVSALLKADYREDYADQVTVLGWVADVINGKNMPPSRVA